MFKSFEGLCNDLILNSRTDLHQHTQVLELGMSDNQLIIYTILKGTLLQIRKFCNTCQFFEAFLMVK